MPLSSQDIDAIVAGRTIPSLFVDQVSARGDAVARPLAATGESGVRGGPPESQRPPPL